MYFFEAAADGFRPGRPVPETTPKAIERAATSPSFADWDGDGDLDMLAGNVQGEVYWCPNLGSRRALRLGDRRRVVAGGLPLTGAGRGAHPVATDWDGDGVLDLLVGCGDGSVVLCRGIRTETYNPPLLETPVPLIAGGQRIKLGYHARLAVADWNEDGQPDLLVGDCEEIGQEVVGRVYLLIHRP